MGLKNPVTSHYFPPVAKFKVPVMSKYWKGEVKLTYNSQEAQRPSAIKFKDIIVSIMVSNCILNLYL